MHVERESLLFILCFQNDWQRWPACSSPLRRSKRTAEIIWGVREEEIITDSDMREIDLYSFQVSCCLHLFSVFSSWTWNLWIWQQDGKSFSCCLFACGPLMLQCDWQDYASESNGIPVVETYVCSRASWNMKEKLNMVKLFVNGK